MQELYHYIATLLKTIKEFKTVAVWNNQTNEEPKELPLIVPAVYFSASITWLSASSGTRFGEATVSIYIATELYETTEDNTLTEAAHFILVDKVYQKLGKNGFVPLSDTPDTNHGNLPVHVSTYRLNFKDSQLKQTNDAAKNLIKQTPNLKVQK